MASKNKQNTEIFPVKEAFKMKFDGEKESGPQKTAAFARRGTVMWNAAAALGN